MDLITVKVRVGRLTESELGIVLFSIKEVCNKVNIIVSEPTKPEPMYREVTLTGSFEDLSMVTNLMNDCKVIYD